jgi:nitrogen-specific signal transduction histidine kinase
MKQNTVAVPSRQEARLATLEAVTDPAITHLALDDFFHKVLARLCAITTADNLAVLLLNEERTALQIRAVQGVEEAVAHEVRVPLGRGFAGRIAAQATPLTCNDPSSVEIITPVLREQLRALLGVPLISEGQVIGVVHMGMKREYAFTKDDIMLLVRVADCFAHAIERARLVEAEQQAHMEAIKRANELETIFETLTDGVLVYDQQGRLLRSNSTARRMLGMQDDPAEFSPRPLAERAAACHPQDEYGHPLASEALPIHRLLRGERLAGSQAVPLRLSPLDGREEFLAITGAPYQDQHGQIQGAICVLRDRTEQKQMQRRLDILDALIQIVETLVQYAPGEEPMESAQQTITTAIARIGDTILTLAQPLLGYSHALLLEVQPDTQILSPLAMAGFPQEQERLLRTSLAGAHLRTLLSDSEIIAQVERHELASFDITGLPLLQRLLPGSTAPACLLAPIAVASRLMGLLGIAFADRAHTLSAEESGLITAMSKLCALAFQYGQQAMEQNRLQYTRDQLTTQLEQINAFQNTLISVVGHEFRTALTGIEGFSALLIEEEFSPEETRDFAMDINKDAIRLRHMITDLLDLEQMKKGQMRLHLERVDLNTVLTEAAKRIRLTQPSHTLLLHLDPGNPHPQGDPEKLAQVVSNLLSNAVKYSPGGGEIVVSSASSLSERSKRQHVRNGRLCP